MDFLTPYLEWIGTFSSIVVAISLTMSSIVKLRWLNLVGAAFFAFYGFAIHALPVGFLNLFIVFANIYYLIKMYSMKESFAIVKTDHSDPYLSFFTNNYSKDIKHFFPYFESKSIVNTENSVAFLLLRNAEVAGLFVAEKNDDALKVKLDFVIPKFRDLKPGDFVYKQNADFFAEMGVKVIMCETTNELHRKYLRKMGFEKIEESDTYIKSVK